MCWASETLIAFFANRNFANYAIQLTKSVCSHSNFLFPFQTFQINNTSVDLTL